MAGLPEADCSGGAGMGGFVELTGQCARAAAFGIDAGGAGSGGADDIGG